MKSIVIVVDTQVGFTFRKETKAVAEKVTRLLKQKPFDYVFATQFKNGPSSSFDSILGWKKLQTPEEQAIVPSILPFVDRVVEKRGYSCVDEDFLDLLKKANDGAIPEKVFLCGLDTDCCVQIIATGLFEKGIRPIVLVDYCGSNGGPEAHEAGVKCLRRLIGIEQLVQGETETMSLISRQNRSSALKRN